jgi:hypothetical protein
MGECIILQRIINSSIIHHNTNVALDSLTYFINNNTINIKGFSNYEGDLQRGRDRSWKGDLDIGREVFMI